MILVAVEWTTLHRRKCRAIVLTAAEQRKNKTPADRQVFCCGLKIIQFPAGVPRWSVWQRCGRFLTGPESPAGQTPEAKGKSAGW